MLRTKYFFWKKRIQIVKKKGNENEREKNYGLTDSDIRENVPLMMTGIDDDTKNSFTQQRRQQIESTSTHIPHCFRASE